MRKTTRPSLALNPARQEEEVGGPLGGRGYTRALSWSARVCAREGTLRIPLPLLLSSAQASENRMNGKEGAEELLSEKTQRTKRAERRGRESALHQPQPGGE